MKKFSLFALVVLLIGCTNDASQDEQLADRLPIKISLEKSRANDTAFESGDQVGLYVVNYNGSTAGTLTSTENHINNACFTLSTDWRAEEELYWKDASTKADFYAYYPYGNPTDVSAYPFSVNTDQSAEADYWASDFLWGKRSGVAPTKNAVTITTEHLLSNALVYIKAGEGYSAAELAAADVEVKICNVKSNATINLATGVATATGSATEITPWNTGAYYRAMIVPQTVSSDTNLVSVKINGKEYAFATDITFTAGIQHKIEVTISAPSNGLVASFSIKEWSLDDNVYEGVATINPGTPMPANNEIWYTSTDGKVVTPSATNAFGANIVSNTYENGKGTIKFDGEITMVEDYAFEDCDSLTSVTIPDSVTEIGVCVFRYCSSLTNITIPNSITSTGVEAFYGCTSLTSVTIGNSLTKIGDAVFNGCTSLTSVTIPDSVTEIGTYTFYGCTSLTSVTIPDSVTSIGFRAFENCTSLTSIYCKPITPPTAVVSDLCWSWSAFNGNASDRKIYVPTASVDAYKVADGWSDYASYIVGYDFENGEVVEPAMPANNEIWYTSTDGKVVAPYATNAFGANIVSNTYENGKGVIKFDGDITSIGESAFEECDSLTSVTIPDSVTEIGDGAFYECNSLTSVKIPDSVTKLGGSVFHGCTSLTSVVIPDSVTELGGSVFQDCTSLTNITIPNSVTFTKEAVFNNCTSLVSVTIGNGLTGIGTELFRNCTSLTSVTIPDSVTSIGSSAFSGCTSLKDVYCKPTTPPTGGYGMFGYSSEDLSCKIYVPTASVNAYKSKQYWKDYADYIVGYNF